LIALEEIKTCNDMEISEKLESIECRKDAKARQVLNVAPDSIANKAAKAATEPQPKRGFWARLFGA